MRRNPGAHFLQNGARVGDTLKRHGVRYRHTEVVRPVSRNSICVEHSHVVRSDAGRFGQGLKQ